MTEELLLEVDLLRDLLRAANYECTAGERPISSCSRVMADQPRSRSIRFIIGVGGEILIADLLRRLGHVSVRVDAHRHPRRVVTGLARGLAVESGERREMLGLATVAITLDTYSHVLPDMQEKAAKALEEVLS